MIDWLLVNDMVVWLFVRYVLSRWAHLSSGICTESRRKQRVRLLLFHYWFILLSIVCGVNAQIYVNMSFLYQCVLLFSTAIGIKCNDGIVIAVEKVSDVIWSWLYLNYIYLIISCLLRLWWWLKFSLKSRNCWLLDRIDESFTLILMLVSRSLDTPQVKEFAALNYDPIIITLRSCVDCFLLDNLSSLLLWWISL